jgi:hypothetical protein
MLFCKTDGSSYISAENAQAGASVGGLTSFRFSRT